MSMSEEAKASTCEAIKGKTVASMVWEPDGGGYWVMTFTDDSEICFNRMMGEL